MAYYKYIKFLEVNSHAAFDTLSESGHPAPHSGIYRCEGCGENIVSTHNHVLPPQNHHQHAQGQGAIRWRLIAATQ